MGSTKFSTTTALALAAVVLSSSTTVFAIAKIPKHSVGAKQLKTSAVTNTKVAKGAITASKVASNALSGSQIKESSLGKVPNANAAGFALAAGNSARLENKGAADFVGAGRMVFGKGSGVTALATTVLALPNLGVTVTVPVDPDGLPARIEVNLPAKPGTTWVVASDSSTAARLSASGGTPVELTAKMSNDFQITAQIWRRETSEAFNLHCVLDGSNPTPFAVDRPMSCLAFST